MMMPTTRKRGDDEACHPQPAEPGRKIDNEEDAAAIERAIRELSKPEDPGHPGKPKEG